MPGEILSILDEYSDIDAAYAELRELEHCRDAIVTLYRARQHYEEHESDADANHALNDAQEAVSAIGAKFAAISPTPNAPSG